MPMALDERTAQAQLTPEERRGMLRAFADRMLLKITAMDDPADMPGVERAVRVAAVIERVYSRCDRAERQVRAQAPALFKAEADGATHRREAIKARVSLANTLKWGEERRLALGPWWDAADSATKTQNPVSPAPESQVPVSQAPISLASAPQAPNSSMPVPASPAAASNIPTKTENAVYSDYTDDIIAARRHLAGNSPPTAAPAGRAHKPPAPA